MVSYLSFLRKQVWQVKICLISSLKTNVFAFANSFWIIVFFKKLSRNFPLNCLTNSLIVSNFIWLNFYTMKFSRFKFSFCWTFNILTHSANIVKRFFNFLPSYVSSFQSLPLFDSLIILPNFRFFVKPFFLLFLSPVHFRAAVKTSPKGCRFATAYLYYHLHSKLSSIFSLFMNQMW